MTEFLDILGLNREFGIMTVRLIVTVILCGVIGWEREIKNQPAGLRTHILVGIGACLMMLVSQFGMDIEHPNVRHDPARIPSYIISSIGFLGAGTIMIKGANIHGLTTAASIWVMAAIGIVVGAGMYALGILATFIVFISLFLLKKIEF